VQQTNKKTSPPPSPEDDEPISLTILILQQHWMQDVLGRMSHGLSTRSFTVVVDDEHHFFLLRDQFAEELRRGMESRAGQDMD